MTVDQGARVNYHAQKLRANDLIGKYRGTQENCESSAKFSKVNGFFFRSTNEFCDCLARKSKLQYRL